MNSIKKVQSSIKFDNKKTLNVKLNLINKNLILISHIKNR